MLINKLRTIGAEIIDAESGNEQFTAIKNLDGFLSSLTTHTFENILAATTVQGGLAVSPKVAKQCLNDYYRTATYIKGIFAAITSLVEQSTDRKIHIVYAGTGPFATLLLPLLPMFENTLIEVTFIDVHKQSMDHLKSIIVQLGMQDFAKDFFCNDAAHFANQQPIIDVLIVETMLNALIEEPQVAVTTSLTPFLSQKGILIPQAIHIDLCFTNYAKLPQFNQPINIASATYQPLPVTGKPKNTIPLFTLSKNTNNLFSDDQTYCSNPISVIKKQRSLDIVLITAIQIYNNLWLYPSNSHITNPYCIGTCNNLASNYFSLEYNYTNTPKWTIKQQ